MKRIALILALAMGIASCALAQQRSLRQLSNEDREKWLTELRTYKHDFLIKELNLTPAQQEAFFPIYDEMDDELAHIATETRELESKVTDSSSDIETEAVARALFEQKGREGAVEIAYFEKLKNTITPRQLLRLKNAERKFTQQLVKHHGRAKAADGPKRKQ